MSERIPTIMTVRLERDDLEALRTAAGMAGKTPDAFVSELVRQAMAIERGTLGKNGAA